MRLNQLLNFSSVRAIGLRCSPASTCGSAQYADNIGSSENDTNSDTSTDAAIVSAKGLNHCPATPYMNATGTNTATIENGVAGTARTTSSVPSCDAVMWSLPISMWRTMFSRPTMASSIRIPIASDSPRSDIVFSVNPNAHTAMNDAITDTGRAKPVMTVDLQELRNTNTTSTVSRAPMRRASSTLFTDAFTRRPESFTTSILTPGGSVFWISATFARTFALTSVVL